MALCCKRESLVLLSRSVVSKETIEVGIAFHKFFLNLIKMKTFTFENKVLNSNLSFCLNMKD